MNTPPSTTFVPAVPSVETLWADRLSALRAQGLSDQVDITHVNVNNPKMLEAYTFAAISHHDRECLALLLPYAPAQTHAKIYKKAAQHGCVDVFRLLAPSAYALSKQDNDALFAEVLPSAIQKDQPELVSWFLSSFYPKPRSELLSFVAANAAQHQSVNVLSMILPDLPESAWSAAVVAAAKFGRDAVFDQLIAARHPDTITPESVQRAQVMAIEHTSTYIARKLWDFSDHHEVIRHALSHHNLTPPRPGNTAHVVNMLHDLWSSDELDQLTLLTATHPNVDGSWMALCPVVQAHQQKQVLLEHCAPTASTNGPSRPIKM